MVLNPSSILLRVASISVILFGLSQSASALEVQVEAVGYTDDEVKTLSQMVLSSSRISERLTLGNARFLNATFMAGEKTDDGSRRDDAAFTLDLYDYSRDQAVEVSGNLNQPESYALHVLAEVPPPSSEEWEQAVAIVKADPSFSANLADWQPYPSMPGIIDDADLKALGLATSRRVIAVGLMPENEKFHHEIVGVDLIRGKVIRFATGAPPTALATSRYCAPANAHQVVTARGVQGQSRVTIKNGNDVIWRFLALRPSASNGRRGSGIDLRDIYYRGKKVLSEIHVPILNVQYEGNICGPYRDWQYSESSFQAQGSLLAPGVLKASEMPLTIMESGRDFGNFRGIAIFTDGSDTHLVTEIEAGWYRYKSEYVFSEDGTIQPRWGFAAVQDSCTCNKHFHHAYWRMDFDLSEEKQDQIQVSDGSRWTDVSVEQKFFRDSRHQAWRVIDPATGAGYTVEPGPHDGTADRFGKGDVWALKFHANEIDDSRVAIGASNNLDAYVNEESIGKRDVVLWYGAHFTHTFEDDRSMNHVVGPILRPVNWPSR